jgi:hypothetical protein
MNQTVRSWSVLKQIKKHKGEQDGAQIAKFKKKEPIRICFLQYMFYFFSDIFLFLHFLHIFLPQFLSFSSGAPPPSRGDACSCSFSSHPEQNQLVTQILSRNDAASWRGSPRLKDYQQSNLCQFYHPGD